MRQQEKNIEGSGTWAEIDLKAVKHNLNEIKKRTQGRKIMAVVKADAYGHGLLPVAEYLEKQNIDQLAVACIEEGLKLRKAGITKPILVFSSTGDIPEAILKKLTLTISRPDMVNHLNRTASLLNRRASVHLNADTGMSRAGLTENEIRAAAGKIHKSSHLNLEGIFTHFSSADTPKTGYTDIQLKRFHNVLDGLKYAGILPPLVHAANSAAIEHCPESWFNMVRPGLFLYGYSPDNRPLKNLKLNPSLKLTTRIQQIKKLKKGTSIGYNNTYTVRRSETIATIPVGYGDGLDRRLSNKGSIIIKGKKAPIVGTVSMDLITVRIPAGLKIHIGEKVQLIGPDQSVEDIAGIIGTIPYEITCGISQRVRRTYYV